MIKNLRLYTLAISSVLFVGCSNGTPIVVVDVDTHYLTDVYGLGIEGVRYYCDSNSTKTFTPESGRFDFNPNGDKCKFILSSDSTSQTDQPLYINSKEKDDSSGVSGLPYVCISGHKGKTGESQAKGYFDHNLSGDECTITYE